MAASPRNRSSASLRRNRRRTFSRARDAGQSSRSDRATTSKECACRAPRPTPARALALLCLLLVAPGCRADRPPQPDPSGTVVVETADPTADAPDGPAATPPPSAESPPTEASGDDSAAPLEGEETPATSDSSQEPAQQDASQAAFDSVTAQLNSIATVQQLILTRLDSMERRAIPDTSGVGETGPDGPDLEGATDDVRGLGVSIFWSLVVLVVFHFIVRAAVWILETLAERSVARRLSIKWLIPITRMVFWGIGSYLILKSVFQVDTQGILAASAALGVGLGIAAQDMLKNVLGGLTVVFDQPFQVGDKISVGGTYGEVVSIGLRSTRIVTADDNLVTVPNSQVVQEQVANANAGQLNCQVVTRLHLPGRIDERRAKEIAFEAAVTSPYIFLNKPVVVLVGDEFRTTFVTEVKVKAYVLDPRFEFLMQSDITERAREGFRAAGLMPEQEWYPRVEAPETRLADDRGRA